MKKSLLNPLQDFIVEPKFVGLRIDQYLVQSLGLARNQVIKSFKESQVWLNGKLAKPSMHVRVEDKVRFKLIQQECTLEPVFMPLKFLYDDKDLVIVDKPAGLVTHPSHGHWEHSLVHGLLYHFKSLSQGSHVLRPGIVHRLDKDTSGCLIVAKNNEMHQALAELFEKRAIEKKYMAVVSGIPSQRVGRIDHGIKRGNVNRKRMVISESGKKAVTHYQLLRKYNHFSVLLLKLETGRTHQIRVHLKSMGLPILGDEMYGKSDKIGLNIPRLMLHAWSIKFKHPFTDKIIHVKSKIPEDMQSVMKKLKKQKVL